MAHDATPTPYAPAQYADDLRDAAMFLDMARTSGTLDALTANVLDGVIDTLNGVADSMDAEVEA